MVTAQSVALCAEACGLGICFLGSTIWEPQRLHELLQVPPGAHVVTSIMLGHPACGVEVQKKARLPFGRFVHRGVFSELPDAGVRALYQAREREGWDRYKALYGPAWVQKLESHRLANLPQVCPAAVHIAAVCRAPHAAWCVLCAACCARVWCLVRLLPAVCLP